MKGAIAKALKELDGLGERAVRTRILGIEDKEEAKEAPLETESKPDDEEEMDSDTRSKLIELLGKE